MNALNAYNRLNANVAGLKKASEKLSSGYRINRAGDDAAGLAISEKMRSQLKGLNQAIRNSQDGINMIQTFEGAAQETHSILQRMKELATESANGTYDNPTDRAAIQLEFEQLNDELNQIADTDFNGTIVLNGGEMSDGLTATMGDNGIGEFNYKDAFDKAAAEAEAAKENAPLEVLDYTTDNRDLATGKTETVKNIVDNQKYDSDAAVALWDKLGLDANKIDEVDITFKKAANGDWTAVAAVDKDGKLVEDIKLSAIKGDAAADAGMTGAGKGGFKVKWDDGAGNDYDVDAIFDAYAAKEGDYLTIKFTNAPSKTHAPDSAGVMEDKLTGTGFNVTVALDATNVTDDTMSPELEAALKELETLEFTAAEDIANAGQATIVVKDPTKLDKLTFDDTSGEVSYIDANGDTKVIATITGTFSGKAAAPAVDTANDTTVAADAGLTGTFTIGTGITKGDTYTLTALGGANYWVGADPDKATGFTLKKANATDATLAMGDTVTVVGGKVTATTNAQASIADSDVDTTAADGTYVYDGTDWIAAIADTEITYDNGALGAGDVVKVDIAAGETDFTLNIDGYKYDADANAIANSTETSDAAKEVVGGNTSAGSDKVTISDAFQNSTARLSYAEHIILQTGARTKDAVDFTFSYNRDGSADMGDLKANLNLSARADGLNTANLNLASQDEANYAIDQIDKAINKTSMVRATFGAIQNRLEHKITNLTTTSENLTEAESSIRDTDMASEMMNYTKFNILQQAAQSMLAQANQQPQSILQLLG